MTILANGDTMRRSVPQIRRNGPCPCGSANKYKRCCLEKDSERLRQWTSIIPKPDWKENLDIEATLRRNPAVRKILKQALARIEPPDDSLARAYRQLQENFAAQIRQTRSVNQELERTRKELKQLQRSQSQVAPAPASPPPAPIQPVQDVSPIRTQDRLSRRRSESLAGNASTFCNVEMRKYSVKTRN